jgi:hypothetical protein
MALWLHPDDADDATGPDELLIPHDPFPLDVQTGVPTRLPHCCGSSPTLPGGFPKTPATCRAARRR